MGEARIPKTLMRSFDVVPPDVHAALFLRHAHRPSIKPGTYGDEVPLSEQGVGDAQQLGAVLAPKGIGRIISSPMPRCVATGQAVARGAGLSMNVIEDARLGVPGPFVEDASIAGPHFLELGPMEVVRRQLNGPPLSGMRSNPEAVSLLMDLVPTASDGSVGLDVLVTHDSIIAAFVGYILETTPSDASWPLMLDGPIVWRTPGGLRVVLIGNVHEAAV